MYRRLSHFTLVLILLSSIVSMLSAQSADEESSGIDALRGYQLVHIAPANTRVVAVSPDLTYLVVDRTDTTSYARVVNRQNEEILILDSTSAVQFISDSTLLHFSGYNTQSPRIYDLTTGEYTSLPFKPGWERPIWRGNIGEDFFFVERGTNYEKVVYFYQPADYSLPPVLVSDVLKGQYYAGDFLLSTDKQTAYIGTRNGVIVWDVASQSPSRTIAYPSAQGLSLSADGRFLGVASGGDGSLVVTLRILDLHNDDAVLFETYTANGGYVLVSPEGDYAAYSVGVEKSGGVGQLHIISLPDGDVIHSIERALHGYYRFASYGLEYTSRLYLWADHHTLAYMANPQNGWTGTLAFYDAIEGTSTVTERSGRLSSVGVQADTVNFITIDRNQEVSRAGDVLMSTPVEVQMPFVTENIIGLGIGIYAPADSGHDALPVLSGRTTGQNINIRSYPSANGTRVGGASGPVTVIATNQNATWVYLAEFGAWASADLVRVDGDLTTLPRLNP